MRRVVLDPRLNWLHLELEWMDQLFVLQIVYQIVHQCVHRIHVYHLTSYARHLVVFLDRPGRPNHRQGRTNEEVLETRNT